MKSSRILMPKNIAAIQAVVVMLAVVTGGQAFIYHATRGARRK